MTPTRRQACTTLALCALFGGTPCATVRAADLLHIDVITTASHPVRLGRLENDPALQIAVTEVDSIARFEEALSAQLPAEPESAQREVLRRLAALQQASVPSLQRAAIGLVLASELGKVAATSVLGRLFSFPIGAGANRTEGAPGAVS